MLCGLAIRRRVGFPTCPCSCRLVRQVNQIRWPGILERGGISSSSKAGESDSPATRGGRGLIVHGNTSNFESFSPAAQGGRGRITNDKNGAAQDITAAESVQNWGVGMTTERLTGPALIAMRRESSANGKAHSGI